MTCIIISLYMTSYNRLIFNKINMELFLYIVWWYIAILLVAYWIDTKIRLRKAKLTYFLKEEMKRNMELEKKVEILEEKKQKYHFLLSLLDKQTKRKFRHEYEKYEHTRETSY